MHDGWCTEPPIDPVSGMGNDLHTSIHVRLVDGMQGFQKMFRSIPWSVLLVSWLLWKERNNHNPVRVFQRNSTTVPPALWESSSKRLTDYWIAAGYIAVSYEPSEN